MTSAQLIDLLIARLVRDHGGTKQHWRKLVGPVQLYSEQTHPHCNWQINPTGTRTEIAKIEKLIDGLRMDHPIIARER
jgi:hypothetical protein